MRAPLFVALFFAAVVSSHADILDVLKRTTSTATSSTQALTGFTQDQVAAALKRAHEESKPTVLEVRTYRYRGHSVADPDTTYRDKQEIEDYKQTKDPIMVYQNYLVHEKVLTDDVIKQIDDAARAEAETSAQFAEASPYPTVEDIKKDVYWEVDNPADRKSQGSLFFDDGQVKNAAPAK